MCRALIILIPLTEFPESEILQGKRGLSYSVPPCFHFDEWAFYTAIWSKMESCQEEIKAVPECFLEVATESVYIPFSDKEGWASGNFCYRYKLYSENPSLDLYTNDIYIYNEGICAYL